MALLSILISADWAIKNPDGSLTATFTFIFLLSCFIFVVMGIAMEQIRPLSWNVSNNSMKELPHSVNITQESFTYELERAPYSSTSDSEDFYDIVWTTMNNRIFSLEATKEFLNKYGCNKNRFPTLAIQHVSLFGPIGTSDPYPVTNLDCGPM